MAVAKVESNAESLLCVGQLDDSPDYQRISQAKSGGEGGADFGLGQMPVYRNRMRTRRVAKGSNSNHIIHWLYVLPLSAFQGQKLTFHEWHKQQFIIYGAGIGCIA